MGSPVTGVVSQHHPFGIFVDLGEPDDRACPGPRLPGSRPHDSRSIPVGRGVDQSCGAWPYGRPPETGLAGDEAESTRGCWNAWIMTGAVILRLIVQSRMSESGRVHCLLYFSGWPGRLARPGRAATRGSGCGLAVPRGWAPGECLLRLAAGTSECPGHPRTATVSADVLAAGSHVVPTGDTKTTKGGSPSLRTRRV
jgi:hypothetical protein